MNSLLEFYIAFQPGTEQDFISATIDKVAKMRVDYRNIETPYVIETESASVLNKNLIEYKVILKEINHV